MSETKFASIDEFLESVRVFEAKIKECIALFEQSFGVPNPCRLWRRGQISRTGKLGKEDCDYSLHGSGCTVELRGDDVSFDFDAEDSFVYSPFKFVSFLDDESFSLKEAETLFEMLRAIGVLHVVDGSGLRLTDKPKG